MAFVETVKNWVNNLVDISLPNIHVTDIVEIILIAFFFYLILVWIKNTRAWMLFRGLLVIIIFFVIAALLQMSTILWLGEKLLSAGIVALVVVFQPELRHALETLGRSNFLKNLFTMNLGRAKEKRFSDKTLTELVKASYDMGSVKTGALIVIEKEVQLTEYERTGIQVDAILTRQLLINIFEKNTPLHDGAIIVRGDRVVAATCYLPLTDDLFLSKDLGTRHRAAVGISEVSDSVTIVVSEETGKISVAEKGKLLTNISEKELTDILTRLQDQDFGRKENKKGTAEVKEADDGKAAEENEKAAKG